MSTSDKSESPEPVPPGGYTKGELMEGLVSRGINDVDTNGLTLIQTCRAAFRGSRHTRAAENFGTGAELKRWKYLYFKALAYDSPPQNVISFRLRADISNGSDKDLGVIEVYKDRYAVVQTNNSVIQNCAGLFPAGWCEGGLFNIYGSNTLGQTLGGGIEKPYKVIRESDVKVSLKFIRSMRAGYKEKEDERTSENFVSIDEIRAWKNLYLIATAYDSPPQTALNFAVRADISGGTDRTIGYITLGKRDYVAIPRGDSDIKHCRGLFCAGYCEGGVFSIYGSNN